MGTYKETTVAGKAAQRGIIEQREQPQRSKKVRLVVVEVRSIEHSLLRYPDWCKWAAYPTLKAAEQTIASKQRSAYYSKYYEFRIREDK